MVRFLRLASTAFVLAAASWLLFAFPVADAKVEGLLWAILALAVSNRIELHLLQRGRMG